MLCQTQLQTKNTNCHPYLYCLTFDTAHIDTLIFFEYNYFIIFLNKNISIIKSLIIFKIRISIKNRELFR